MMHRFGVPMRVREVVVLKEEWLVWQGGLYRRWTVLDVVSNLLSASWTTNPRMRYF